MFFSIDIKKKNTFEGNWHLGSPKIDIQKTFQVVGCLAIQFFSF